MSPLAAGCTDVKTNLDKYFKALKSYDDSRLALFGNIENDLNSMLTKNKNLISNRQNFDRLECPRAPISSQLHFVTTKLNFIKEVEQE